MASNKWVFYDYEELKKIVNEVGIKNNKEYLQRYKDLKSEDGKQAPQKPYKTYLNKGWQNWYEFIPERTTKKENNSKKYFSLEELKTILHDKKVYTRSDYWVEYKNFTNSDGLIAPCNPCIFYGEECKTLEDILCPKEKYIEYGELKIMVQKLKMKSHKEYRKRYKNIINENGLIAPYHPEETYLNLGWENYGEFLGTGFISNSKREKMSFENARDFVRSLKLERCSDFYKLDNLPSTIPKFPYSTYKNSGWKSLYDWVGVENNKISKGESIIIRFLNDNKVDYKYNTPIGDCKNIILLKFDFHIPNKNICIEYDGKQHYEIIDYFGGEKRFNESKARDEIKDKYCKDNGIKMIRIPYWLTIEEIYEILTNELLITKNKN